MMPELNFLGKILILFGLIIAGIGVIVLLGAKIPFLGRLPGDILIRRKNFTFYFPPGHLHNNRHHPHTNFLAAEKKIR